MTNLRIGHGYDVHRLTEGRALILGGVSFGVGLLTGGDIDRIILNLDEHYQVMTYINTYTGYVRQLFQQLVNLFV